MRVSGLDIVVDAALDAARAAGVAAIVRLQDAAERRIVVADGAVERQRTSHRRGLAVHVFTAEGHAGFASTDELTPAGARAAVRDAASLACAAGRAGGEPSTAVWALAEPGRREVVPVYRSLADTPPEWQARALLAAQALLAEPPLGPAVSLRTTHHAVDDEWRVARTDGADVAFAMPRAFVRHDLTVRRGEAVGRASVALSGPDACAVLAEDRLGTLARRGRLAAGHAVAAATAPPPPAGSWRLVLDHALAKGLAHEAIGHLCESDVDGSALMRGGRLRLGERLARPSISVVDGPLPGDYAWQPVSANGLDRQTVALVDNGVLAAGLGDLFSAAQAGVAVSGACRAASFRDRPMPRMTNIRIVDADAASLDADPELLTPEDVAAALRRLGLLERGGRTLYLTGYAGGQAHPRRGDFVFGAGCVFDLGEGGAPRRAATFSGLAERALAAIYRGIGPLRTDAIGTCGKDGSIVTSSGGSHALLVLDPDPDLVISAGP